MRESKFIEQNKDKWFGFEKLLNSENKDPEQLSNLFIQITDDLSYARTFYNNRTIRVYLNNLCQQLFYKIYKTPKKVKQQGTFVNFWKIELPQIAYASRIQLLGSFLIFLLALVIGIISSIYDPEFVRVIMGDAYVNMTIENIQSGDPMAVYKKMNEMDMFLGISLNNLVVAVQTFLMGILWAAGSIIILLQNGIMVGAFQYFFIEQGLFQESFLSIWLHGTLEISSIVIAGAAGLVLGKGIIAPGSYTRLQAFQIAAKRGAKLFLGVAPIIVIAAVIESFLTRYTEAPDFLRLTLIIMSLIFIITYFIWYPHKVVSKFGELPQEANSLQESPNQEISYKGCVKSGADLLKDTFTFYGKYSNRLIQLALYLAVFYVPITLFFIIPNDSIIFLNYSFEDLFGNFIKIFYSYENAPLTLVFNSVLFGCFSILLIRMLVNDINKKSPKLNFSSMAGYIIIATLMNLIILSIYYVSGFLHVLIAYFLNPILTILLFTLVYSDEFNLPESWQKTKTILKDHYGFVYGLSFMIMMIVTVCYLLFNSALPLMYLQFIQWNLPIEHELLDKVIIITNTSLSFFIVLLISPMFYIPVSMSYFTLEEQNEANDLKKKLEVF